MNADINGMEYSQGFIFFQDAKKHQKFFARGTVIMFLKENIIPVLLRQLVTVAQLVRASDCGSEGRGFETHQSPLAAVSAVWR